MSILDGSNSIRGVKNFAMFKRIAQGAAESVAATKLKFVSCGKKGGGRDWEQY